MEIKRKERITLSIHDKNFLVPLPQSHHELVIIVKQLCQKFGISMNQNNIHFEKNNVVVLPENFNMVRDNDDLCVVVESENIYFNMARVYDVDTESSMGMGGCSNFTTNEPTTNLVMCNSVCVECSKLHMAANITSSSKKRKNSSLPNIRIPQNIDSLQFLCSDIPGLDQEHQILWNSLEKSDQCDCLWFEYISKERSFPSPKLEKFWKIQQKRLLSTLIQKSDTSVIRQEFVNHVGLFAFLLKTLEISPPSSDDPLLDPTRLNHSTLLNSTTPQVSF